MNQQAGILPGVKPKWLFYEAAGLTAELAAHSFSREMQDYSLIFRLKWKDYATWSDCI